MGPSYSLKKTLLSPAGGRGEIREVVLGPAAGIQGAGERSDHLIFERGRWGCYWDFLGRQGEGKTG